MPWALRDPTRRRNHYRLKKHTRWDSKGRDPGEPEPGEPDFEDAPPDYFPARNRKISFYRSLPYIPGKEPSYKKQGIKKKICYSYLKTILIDEVFQNEAVPIPTGFWNKLKCHILKDPLLIYIKLLPRAIYITRNQQFSV
jgi:hypothetical protein